MKTIRQLRLGHRVVGTLLLLLLLLALGNILSVRQTLQLDAQLGEVVAITLPAARLVNDLTSLVDDSRGIAALHLMLGDAAGLAALEVRLQGRRQALAQRLAAYRPQPGDATDLRHHDTVQACLADFWVEQDKLLALSRQARIDPAAAGLARAQLSGPAQQAFQKLGAALEAWWAFNDERAAQAAQRAHADVGRVMAMLAMLGTAALVLGGVCVVLMRRSIRRSLAPLPDSRVRSADPSAAAPDIDRLADSLDRLAMQAQLLALTATVEAARAGTNAGGMTRVADDARSLAQGAASLARDLQARDLQVRTGGKPERASARSQAQGGDVDADADAARGEAADAARLAREPRGLVTPGDHDA